MQRRTWLKLGIVSAAVLAVTGGGLALVSPGLDAEGRLTDAGRTVFGAVAVGILNDSLPTDNTARQTAVQGMLLRIDELTHGLPPHAQAELSQLLALLATSGGRIGMAALTTDWPAASIVQIQEALQSMRLSSLGLKRQAYAALHDISGAAYFSDPSTWTALGYPGPLEL
jgi:hypothetical protein